MHLTLSLLAASWMAGAPDAVPSYYPYPSDYSATAPQAPAAAYAPTAPPRPGLRERLRNLFSRHSTQPTGPEVSITEVRPGGVPAVTRSGTVQQTSGRTFHPLAQLRDQELKMVGHDPNYAWITGKLVRVPGRETRWVVVYAGSEEIDRYGGSVMLNLAPDLNTVHEGDLVCVQGQVVHGSGAAPFAGAYYRVQRIDLVTPPTR